MSKAFKKELSVYHSAGVRDYANVGSPAENAADAGIQATDSLEAAKKKLAKMLREEVSVDDFRGGQIEGRWSARQKRELLDAWIDGWSTRGAKECLELVQARAED